MYDYYDYGSSYYSRPHTYSGAYSSPATSAAVGGVLGFVAFMWILCLVLGVLTIIGRWKMFKKGGIDGWESLIPGHGLVVEFQLAGIPTYWYFLLLVPFANIFIMGWKDIELAKSFGRSTGFGIGLLLLAPIFYPILGLSKAQYVGPHYQETVAQDLAYKAAVQQRTQAVKDAATAAKINAATKVEEPTDENK